MLYNFEKKLHHLHIFSGAKTVNYVTFFLNCVHFSGKKHTFLHNDKCVCHLELVRDFMTERERGNFVLDKADFADVAGSYGEKIQRSIK